jgi:starch-binding outer membrane protein, SusD/RagB family
MMILQGCDKFLEEDPLSIETPETYMKTQDGIESLVGSAYIGLRVWYGRENGWDYTESGTDIYGRGYDNRSAAFCTYSSALTGEEQERSGAIWYELYVAVNTCNFILANIDDSPVDDKAFLAKRKGEILFLRAHYYWQIVETWGGVYLATKPTQTASHEAQRSSVDDFYTVIFNDLGNALELCPEENEYGRINKDIVRAFLARMYLTRGNDAMAKQYADQVIGGGYQLISSWDELWALDNNKNSEVIWPVVYSNNTLTMSPRIRNQASIDNNTGLPVLWDNAPGFIQREGGNSGLVMWQIRYEEIPSSGWGMTRDILNGRGFLRWMPTRFFIDLYDETVDQRWSSFQRVWICNDVGRTPKYKLSDASETGYETELYFNGELVEWPDSLNGQPFFNVGDTAFVFSKQPIDTTKYMRLRYNLPEIEGQPSRDYFMPYPIDPVGKYYVLDIDKMFELNEDGVYANRRAYFTINGKYRDSTIASLDVTGTDRDIWAIRLAEMYYIAAEAEVNMNGGTGTQAAYNYLLTLANARAIGGDGAGLLASYGVSSAEDVDIDFILDERARELATEHHRWFDLKRTGKLVERVRLHNPEGAANIQEFHNLRFIPQAMLDALYNRDEFGQNPGY